jgi:hypothetical protein
MEENGRGHGDPWSLRQFGVYHQLYYQRNSSTWVIIQLPDQIKEHLNRVLDESQVDPKGSYVAFHPLRFHFLFLLACEMNWEAYISYLGKELALIVPHPTISLSRSS